MNKKNLFVIIAILTIIVIFTILLFTVRTRYNKLILSETEWNNIISNRTASNLSLENIEFNDYNLIIDNENSIIYYSVVESKNKYNPLVKSNLKIAFSSEISDQNLESNDIKVIVYDDKYYHIYSLYITSYPILNFSFDSTKTKNIKAEITLFDNHINISRKVMKSEGKLTIRENNEYAFSLIKESIGHNKRDNNVSIFGLPKENDYILKLAENPSEKAVQLFINNKYVGLYTLSHLERRGLNERN